MPSAPGFTLDAVSVRVPASVLLSMTEEQRERIEVLVRGFNASAVELIRDSWQADSVLFTLRDNEGAHLLSGLIEADGCAHT
jgi:hypothetical protein